MLIHTRIDRSFPNEWAARYVRAMRDEPALAESISWCLQALGPSIAPQIRVLYDYPEPKPRLSALRAGARLGDALVTPHLKEIAMKGEPALRLLAIEKLAEMPPNPRLNVALRELVDADDLTVRIAAYEALVARRDPWIVLSKEMGVERTLYTTANARGEFRLDVVRSNKPMIYISQQGEPRVVIFGESLQALLPVDGLRVGRPPDDRGRQPRGAARVRYQGCATPPCPSRARRTRTSRNSRRVLRAQAHASSPLARARDDLP